MDKTAMIIVVTVLIICILGTVYFTNETIGMRELGYFGPAAFSFMGVIVCSVLFFHAAFETPVSTIESEYVANSVLKTRDEYAVVVNDETYYTKQTEMAPVEDYILRIRIKKAISGIATEKDAILLIPEETLRIK